MALSGVVLEANVVAAIDVAAMEPLLRLSAGVAGRTAREGRKGRAVTLVTEEEEVERLGTFGRELGIKIEKVDVRFLRGY